MVMGGELILEKWHPMGVSFDGRGGMAIAASSNYGLKGHGGLRIIPDLNKPNVYSEWSASTAIYDVKAAGSYYYAAGADGFIYQVDLYGRMTNRTKAHEREINRLANIAGARLASASWDGTAGVWDSMSLKSIQKIKPNQAGGAVNEISFSPDGNVLACANMAGPISLWDLRSNQRIVQIPTHDSPLTIKFSPDGRKLAFGGLDNDIHVVEFPSTKKLRSMKGHYRTVRQLTWLSTEEILSVGYDMSARWWNINLSEPLLKSNANFTEFVVACDSDINKRLVVIGSWDRKITFYDY